MASHDSSEVRFAAYIAALVGVIGHADRATPLRDYCTGLLMPTARKSVEPMAAVTARVAAQHQSLLHFVGQAPWSETAVLTKVRDLVLLYTAEQMWFSRSFRAAGSSFWGG